MAVLKRDSFYWFTNEYPDDWVGFNHEPWIPDYLTGLLPEDGVFLDVGGHVGRYSVRLSEKASKVVAIEPFPTGLLATLALNGIDNVEVLRCAAWSHQTNLRPEGWGGSTHLVEDPDGHIMAERIDDLDLPYADLVKIDVEGAEAEVLRGMQTYLKVAKPKVFIEMHDSTYAGVDRRLVYQALDNAGYGYKPAGTHNNQWYLLAEHGSQKNRSLPEDLEKNRWPGDKEGVEGADEKRLCLNWHYQNHPTNLSGYAYVARMFLESIKNLGVDMDAQSRSIVFHTVPWTTFSWYEDQKAAILSMWEHTELPPGVKAGLDLFDLHLPPCQFSADLFAQETGIPQAIVPHGIDPSAYYPSEPRKRPQALRILAAATNLRKGPLEVLEGLRKLDLPWELSLKGTRAKEFDPDLENVHILDGQYEDLRPVYTDHDLYVSGSRGEGWDLIAWEALACGVPTIVPAHTGYMDWGHLAQAWLTNFHMEESLVKVFGDSGEWYVQDPDEIAKQVTYVWEHYDELAEEAWESARTIGREWTWEHAAFKMLLALQKNGFKLESYDPQGKKDRTPLVAIKGTRSIAEGFDVGGYQLAPFHAGVTYKVPSEVARVLKDSGHAEIVA